VSPRPLADLARDDAGATYVELVIVILPVLTLALGILQLTELYTAKIAVDHAAANAARSASVVFADDPKFYGGGGQNQGGDARTTAVKTAAARALAPFVLDGSIRTVDVTFPDGTSQQRGAPLTAQVESTYRCGVPLVHHIVCAAGGGTLQLAARATFASNAANYEY
jgi:Flp pilus assembly protein TadG